MNKAMSSAMRSSALLLIVMLLCTNDANRWRCDAAIDCRRFVFAPICRGASAKRAELAALPSLHDFKLKRLDPSRKTFRSKSFEDNQLNPQQEIIFNSILSKYWDDLKDSTKS